MEIILLERVEKLGLMGDVVTVKNGFARNFLLPRRKAMRATKANIAAFENQRKDLEARNLERKAEADAVAEQVEGTSVVLIRQAGETGQLYGSVSARDVAEALDTEGLKIDRSQVVLDRPIKALGLHDLRIVLHPEVFQIVQVNVARSTDEAELQAKGINVVDQDDDDDDDDGYDAQAAAEEVFEEDDSESSELSNEDADEASDEAATDDSEEETAR
jgi:large subunit ribosomal protein L9